MPSVRPRLVEEGEPIVGGNSKDDVHTDNDHKQQNQFTIGGGRSSLSSQYRMGSVDSGNSKLSSLSPAVAKPKPSSSLARLSQGKFSAEKTKRPSTSTSYVVGGTSSAATTSSDHDYYAMALDDHHHHHDPSPRNSVTRHSFQVPGNDSGSVDMDVDHHHHETKLSSPTATKFVVGSLSSSVAPTYDTTTTTHLGNSPQTRVPGPEKMEGVIDLSTKPPMVVLDGANVAYAYANSFQGTSSSLQQSHSKIEPDPKGIDVACKYFLDAGIRVMAVLPASWMNRKPRADDPTQANAAMLTPQLEVLQHLHQRGLLVAAPPRDDDDAYAITIARREDSRARQRDNHEGPGYVLSNDMFRDAMDRDDRDHQDGTRRLRDWLTKGSTEHAGPGRISFAFCDTGSLDDHGDRILDVVPNPRHPIIRSIEKLQHAAT